LNLSLLQVESRTSYPLVVEQLVREEVKQSAPKAVKEKHPRRGRPKGSANKSRKDVDLSPFQTQLQGCIRAALKLIGTGLGIVVSCTTAHWGTMRACSRLRQRGCA
jgi:putative transposase